MVGEVLVLPDQQCVQDQVTNAFICQDRETPPQPPPTETDPCANNETLAAINRGQLTTQTACNFTATGQVFNLSTCECETTCGTGLTWNVAEQACEGTCTAPETWNFATQSCELVELPPEPCPPGQFRNEDTGLCEPGPPCDGQTTCDQAAMDRLTARATAAGRTIRSFSFNTEICRCQAQLNPVVPPPFSCTPPQEECTPTGGTRGCYDPCIACYTRTANCGCQAPAPCPAGQRRDNTTCQCVEGPCPPGQRRPTGNDFACAARSTTFTGTLDPNRCYSTAFLNALCTIPVRLTIFSGLCNNPGPCRTVASSRTETRTSGAGTESEFQYDFVICTTSSLCGAGQVCNEVAGTCVSTGCPEGYTFNTETLICDPPPPPPDEPFEPPPVRPTCPPPRTLNPATGLCDPPPIPACIHSVEVVDYRDIPRRFENYIERPVQDGTQGPCPSPDVITFTAQQLTENARLLLDSGFIAQVPGEAAAAAYWLYQQGAR